MTQSRINKCGHCLTQIWGSKPFFFVSVRFLMMHFLRVSLQHTTLETEEILSRMWAPKLLKSCSAKQGENYITSVLQQKICGVPNKKQFVPL